jgi:glycosyltransferase involved in cell wall biosynthesis
MTRLLFITAETWPTFRADVAVLFGRYLPRLGIHSDLVTGQTLGEAAPPWGGGEARLADVSGGQVKKHLKTFFHIWRELRRIDASRYQAIQVRDLPLPAALALWMARRKGLSLFYWMSYPMPEGQIALARERGLSQGLMKFLFPWVRGRLGRFLLYRVVLPRADHVFVQSARMKQDLIARGIAAEKMTPVPMGVDLDAMQAEAIPPADDTRLVGRRVLVYLGTLDRPRRIEVLFDMLARVRQESPGVILVLVGDTEDKSHRAWLKAQAEKAGVTKDVLWTGWLPMREGWRYVRAAELGLSPFPRGYLLDSASPTKVPEYLVLGVPVVCNDNPDQQALIQASGAGRCVPYKAEDFARAVVELLRLAPEERRAMAERGRELVARERIYSLLAAKAAACYRNILSE